MRLTECAWLLLQLYTQEFYETVVKQKLNPGGIFVTQSGPAGVMSASQVRSRDCWREKPKGLLLDTSLVELSRCHDIQLHR